MNTSLPGSHQAPQPFYQTLDDYLQLVQDTYGLPETLQEQAPSSCLTRPVEQSAWTQIRQRQIQEWKQHYDLLSQAIRHLKAKNQQWLAQAGPISLTQHQALMKSHHQQISLITGYYESKRNLIWQAHQQELAQLGACL